MSQLLRNACRIFVRGIYRKKGVGFLIFFHGKPLPTDIAGGKGFFLFDGERNMSQYVDGITDSVLE